MSPTQPNFVPSNVHFEVDDVEDPWVLPTDKLYSFIFCRYMAASILDWPRLVGRIFESGPSP